MTSGQTGRLTCGALKEGTKIRVQKGYQGLCFTSRTGIANSSCHGFWEACSHGRKKCGNVKGTEISVSSSVQGCVEWSPDNPLTCKLPGARANVGEASILHSSKIQRDGEARLVPSTLLIPSCFGHITAHAR